MLENKLIKQAQLIKIQETQDTQQTPQTTPTGPQTTPVAPLPVLTQGYIQGVLKSLLGYYVELDFLVGTESKVTKKGYLANVGVNFIIIYDVENQVYISCDIYSITFIYFGKEYDPQYIVPKDYTRRVVQPPQEDREEQ